MWRVAVLWRKSPRSQRSCCEGNVPNTLLDVWRLVIGWCIPMVTNLSLAALDFPAHARLSCVLAEYTGPSNEHSSSWFVITKEQGNLMSHEMVFLLGITQWFPVNLCLVLEFVSHFWLALSVPDFGTKFSKSYFTTSCLVLSIVMHIVSQRSSSTKETTHLYPSNNPKYYMVIKRSLQSKSNMEVIKRAWWCLKIDSAKIGIPMNTHLS